MDKNIDIFSVPRTGSTFISNLLNSLKEFDFLGEVYHHEKVYASHRRKLEIVDYILHNSFNENIKIDYNNLELSLVKFSHDFPEYFFESMQKTSNSKYFGFKVFQGHLKL